VFRSILDPKTASYNPLADLTPLGLAMRSPTILAVRGDAPYKTLGQMAEHGEKEPGERAHRDRGGGIGGRFLRVDAQFAHRRGPHHGAVHRRLAAVTALLGGHVEGVVLALGHDDRPPEERNAAGIVISSKYPDFPDIPTLPELGYSEQLFGVWVGFSRRQAAGRSRANLVPALERAIKSPAIGAKLKPLGMLMEYSPPEKLLAEIREEHARVRELARKAGLLN